MKKILKFQMKVDYLDIVSWDFLYLSKLYFII
jgi:hypothetical protein